MAERRRERILRICDEMEGQGVPDYALEPVRDYASAITYCRCGHERTEHGSGIVDCRCFVAGCGCADFERANQ